MSDSLLTQEEEMEAMEAESSATGARLQALMMRLSGNPLQVLMAMTHALAMHMAAVRSGGAPPDLCEQTISKIESLYRQYSQIIPGEPPRAN